MLNHVPKFVLKEEYDFYEQKQQISKTQVVKKFFLKLAVTEIHFR